MMELPFKFTIIKPMKENCFNIFSFNRKEHTSLYNIRKSELAKRRNLASYRILLLRNTFNIPANVLPVLSLFCVNMCVCLCVYVCLKVCACVCVQITSYFQIGTRDTNTFKEQSWDHFPFFLLTNWPAFVL